MTKTKVVGAYIRTTKTISRFKFWFLTSFLQNTTLQINKEKQLIDSFSLFPRLYVSKLIESLVDKEIVIESRLWTFEDNCTFPPISFD